MTEYLHPDGNRVAKGTIQLVSGQLSCDTTQNGFTLTNSYILTPSGQQLTEMIWSGGTAQWSHTNVWVAGAGLIATYSADPDPSQGVAAVLDFQFGDWLGTRRVLTDYTGNVEETCDSLPYGNGETCAPTPTEHLYTQHERDAETNNDYFGARYYSSDAGRFLTPDWSAKTEPVPYAKLDNPQSLNLYGYVGDNPLGGVDEFGHQSQLVCNAVNCSPFNDNTDKAQTANLQAQQQNAGASAGQGGAPVTLTLSLGGVNVKVTYRFGAIFSNYAGGMEITADPQNCNSCTWSQVVSRTGVGAQRPTKDGEGIGPLYGQEGGPANAFYDTPANTSGPGTFRGTALVGTANIGGKSFSARGAMTYEYGISGNGVVRMIIRPRVATSAEMNGAIKVLRDNSPDWQIQ